MKKEELKEKKLQAEAKLTDEQLKQCNAGMKYQALANYQGQLDKGRARELQNKGCVLTKM